MSNTDTPKPPRVRTKVLKQIYTRGNNRRIQISMVQDRKGPPYFVIQCRMLVDRKTRTINRHTMILTAETFAIMGDLYTSFVHDTEVINECNRQMQNPLYKSNYFKIMPHEGHPFVKTKTP